MEKQRGAYKSKEATEAVKPLHPWRYLEESCLAVETLSMMFETCYLSYVVAMPYYYFQYVGLGPTNDVLCYF